VLVIVIGLFVVVGALIGLRAARQRGAASAFSDAAMSDSVDTANNQHRWVSYLYWVGQLDLAHPHNSDLVRRRGAGWHNFAVEARPMLAMQRPALRTSLERIASERRALVLLDSAATLATTPQQWSSAHLSRGRVFEHLGLPGDALIAYERVKQKYPDDRVAQMGAYWVHSALDAPDVADTLQWARLRKTLPKPPPQ
jgi:hypothetical protein